MDEEDLQELKDGQNLVDTTDEMDLVGGTKAELQRRGGMEESEECVQHYFTLMLRTSDHIV